MTKEDIRSKMLSLREMQSKKEKSKLDNLLNEKLKTFLQKVNPKVVHTYLPIGSEIDFYSTIEFLLEKKIVLVCPEARQKPFMKHWILESIDDIEKGRYNTWYPNSNKEYEGDYELILVPGLAFNNKNYRLGYGGGYYDYFLKSQPKAVKLGLFYSFQRMGDLPIEKHDIPLDIIITDDD